MTSKSSGNLLDFQRLGGGHDAGVAQIKSLGQGGLGTDRDNGLVKCNDLLALGGFDAQGLRAFEIAAPGQDLHAALFGQETDPAGKFVHDGVFPGAQFVHFDLGRAEGDAAMGGFPGLADHFGGVQQGLGGNAAAIEANAAQLFVLFDEKNFFAEVGGVKGGGVAARARAQNHNLCMNGVHDKLGLRNYVGISPVVFRRNFSNPLHQVNHEIARRRRRQ